MTVAQLPLLAPWSGPHGGVPNFDQVKVEDFAPALEQGMADHLRELELIAEQSAAPTFENTLGAIERSGQSLDRAQRVFEIFSSARSSPQFRAVEAELNPRLSAYRDQIFQNERLFARIRAVYESKDKASLNSEQQRVSWLYFTTFVRLGATLEPQQKAQLSEWNQQLAGLCTRFAQNQLADEEEHALVIDRQEDLAGLPASQVADAASEAERRGLKGQWVIANTRSSMEPFLTYAANRGLRERGFRMWVSRGDNGDGHDNNDVARQILALRAKKATLLGSKTFAHWHLSDTMAKEPQAAMALMRSVWAPAVAQFRADVAEAQALADREGVKIEPWDYRYYAEKLRKAKYDLDLGEVKPYLRLPRIRQAMFWVAEQLYGLHFTLVQGLSVYHPDVSVYEVTGAGGAHVGYWYFDPFARPGKQSGAWMSAWRPQHRLEGEVSTIVSNTANFNQGGPGQDATLSWDDAVTMFHEFGHALHGLNSKVTYPFVSGTSVARDFVELPSQFHENYLSTSEVLKFLVDENHQPIPQSLLERIEKARRFNQGFATAEAQASAIVDMRLHLAEPPPDDLKAFERDTLAELGMPPQLVMRHRIPAFGHIFAGDGYAAGYYSYLWAEVLEHDAFEAFTEAGGPFDPHIARRFNDTILSVGNSVDPAVAFRAFRGRDPKSDALLRFKGFPVPV